MVCCLVGAKTIIWTDAGILPIGPKGANLNEILIEIQKFGLKKIKKKKKNILFKPLQWRHNGHKGSWNHQSHDCLLKDLFRRRLKKKSKLHVTGLCQGNSPVTQWIPRTKGQ